MRIDQYEYSTSCNQYTCIHCFCRHITSGNRVCCKCGYIEPQTEIYPTTRGEDEMNELKAECGL